MAKLEVRKRLDINVASWTKEDKKALFDEFDHNANLVVNLGKMVKELKEQLENFEPGSDWKTKFDSLTVESNRESLRKDVMIEELQREVQDKDKEIAKLKNDLEKARGVNNAGGQASSASVKQDLVQLRGQTSGTPEVKSCRLDPNTPTYSGRKDENFDKWKFLVLKNIKAAQIPQTLELSAIVNYVKDNALNALIHYESNTYNPSLEGFFECLKAREGTIDKKGEKNILLSRLTQTGSFDAYCQKFQDLAMEASLPEEILIQFFIAGLKPKTRGDVKAKDPKSLSQTIEYASIYESVRSESSHVAHMATIGNNKVSKDTECYRCHRYGHVARDCPMVKNQDNRSNKTQCHNCKGYGHIARDCRKPRAASSYNGNNRQRSASRHRNGNRSNRGTSWSGQKKAYISTAENNDDNNNNNNNKKKNKKSSSNLAINLASSDLLPAIDGFINAVYIDRMVLDTGATTSIMSKRTAEKVGAVINPNNSTLTVAGDGEIKVLGETSHLQVDVGGKYVDLSFLVLDVSQFDVLLGMDYFHLSGAGIIPKGRKFFIDDLEVPLSNSEPSEEICFTIEDSDFDMDQFENLDWSCPLIEIKSSIELPTDIQTKFDALGDLIRSNMATSYKDLKEGIRSPPGYPKLPELTIKLTESKIIHAPIYRQSLKEKELVLKMTDELLDAGILRLSTSPYQSPIFLLKKNDGEYRPVVDFKLLNKQTEKEDWTIPIIHSLLFLLRRAVFFSVCDAKGGFFQVFIDESSRKFTAFSDGTRKLEWCRMAMGLKNSPIIFCKIMHMILGDLPFVIIYIDDMCIFSESAAQHIEHIKIVMERLHLYNVKLNPKKCVWFAKKFRLLGHIVSEKGIEMDPKKVEPLTQMTEPTNVKELMRFIGCINYYAKFFKHFADHMACFYELTKKDKIWFWSEDCRREFKYLIGELMKAPVLRHPDLSRQFLLYTDASSIAIAAILAQVDDNGVEYVVEYASRMLRGYERHRSVSEKELSAVVFGCKSMRCYIFGADCIVITDHSALTFMIKLSSPSSTIARLLWELAPYDIKIVHRPGKDLGHVDYLTRPPGTEPVCTIATLNVNVDDEEDVGRPKNNPYTDSVLKHYILYRRCPPGCSRKQCNRVRRLAINYDYRDSKLYVKKADMWVIFPPQNERAAIIDRFHSISGHSGVDSTYVRLREEYFWPKMIDDVRRFKQRCESCVRNDNHLTRHHPAFANKVTNINDMLQIDFVWGLPQTKDKEIGLMGCAEGLSDFIQFYALKGKSEDDIVYPYTKHICTFGPPKSVMSDNEPALKSVLSKLKSSMGVDYHKLVAAYSPSHNGRIEGDLKWSFNVIRKLCETYSMSWKRVLPFVEFAHNTMRNVTTGSTPYKLMFGIECNRFNDWSCYEGEPHDAAVARRSNELALMTDLRKIAIERMNFKRVKQSDDLNTVNKRVERTFLPKNTVVYRKNEGILTKLAPRWLGPYKIFDHDMLGNYFLVDALGNGLGNKFPREKLYVVPAELYREDVDEVKSILKDRKVGNKLEYLVEWKNDPVHSWVKEDDFQSVDVINNYWNAKAGASETSYADDAIIHQPNLVVRKKRGRKPKTVTNEDTTIVKEVQEKQVESIPVRKSTRNKKVTFDVSLTILALFLLLLPAAFCALDHKFCRLSTQMPRLKLDDLCKWEHTAPKFEDLTIKYRKFRILNKLHHEVSGIGYECSVYQKLKECTDPIIGGNFCISRDWEALKLSATQCWSMANHNFCEIKGENHYFGKQMNCSDKGCFLLHEEADKYNWGFTNKLYSHRCEVNKVQIIAQFPNASIFSETDCRFNDFQCIKKNSIMVWNDTIRHECPFEYMRFDANKFTWQSIDGFQYLVNHLSTLILRPTRDVIRCETDMLETNEGLYIMRVPSRIPVELNYIGSIDSAYLEKLLISSIDYSRFAASSSSRIIEFQVCSMLSATLSMFRRQNNTFLRTVTSSNREIILFSLNYIVYIPECFDVTNVTFNPIKNFCFKEVPVIVVVDGKNLTGFLDSSGVIRKVGNAERCEKNSEVAILNNDLVIQRIYDDYKMIKREQINYGHVEFLISSIKDFNTQHAVPLLEGSDNLKDFYEVEHRDENGFSFVVAPAHDDIHQNLSLINSAVFWLKEKIGAPFLNFFHTLYVIIFAIGLAVVVLAGISLYLKIRKIRYGNSRNYRANIPRSSTTNDYDNNITIRDNANSAPTPTADVSTVSTPKSTSTERAMKRLRNKKIDTKSFTPDSNLLHLEEQIKMLHMDDWNPPINSSVTNTEANTLNTTV